MATRSRDSFITIRSEGAILPADLLRRIVDGGSGLDGLTPSSYHLVEGERLNEAINHSWSRLLGLWASFRGAVAKLAPSDAATGLTRDRWLLPLFQELGYGRLQVAKAVEINGKSYALSHSWGHAPIHLVGCRVDLDRRSPGVAGAAKGSPHSLLQEVLNGSSNHLWGFVSNGLRLRVLRDNARLTRQAYVEFDLEAMFEGQVYTDFVLLWLVCHQSRIEAEQPALCWLERWSRAAQEQGTRALEQLRDGVEEAITALGSGFLAHQANGALRERLRSGALSTQDYYRQLLRLVYRLLFLFVAEDRELLLDPKASPEARERYSRYYSLTSLRRLAERRVGTRHADLYQRKRLVMRLLGSDEGALALGLPALGGFLFSSAALPDLEQAELANHDLLDAIRALAFVSDRHGRRLVDYKNLGAEELGSVYESLLELHPDLNIDAPSFALDTAGGSERKTSGSYYTPTGLITCLLNSALDPVLDAVAQKPKPEEAILNLKIVDPACGSGHFLIAAAHRLARRLAALRTGDEEPAPEALRSALREVIGRCIYGVDSNPMAVELCKVSLWMEALEPGKPLTFLDHHIQCGNSLFGATPTLLKEGIPDTAFEPMIGDDRAVCNEYRKRNKKEHSGQASLFDAAGQPWERLGNLATAMSQLETIPDDTIAGIRRKQAAYEALVRSSGYEFGRLLADLWCAAFVWHKTDAFPFPITEEVFRRAEHNPFDLANWMKEEVSRLATSYQFFHWHLAFPDVFHLPTDDEPPDSPVGWNGGFDVVLGNPPWEKFTLAEEEWFAVRAPEIAETKGKDRRGKLIAHLAHTLPRLHEEWQRALRGAEVLQHVLSKKTGLYPLTGSGELNTYHLFTERADQLLRRSGRVGLIVKTGIGSADNCLPFFKKVTDGKQLASLYDFVNSKPLFPAVQTVERFSLITFGGIDATCDEIAFATLCRDTPDLELPGRTYRLTPEDIALMSPLNGACPLLKGERDGAIMRRIYRTFPVLGQQDLSRPLDFWNTNYVRIFDMATDSGHFKKREELEPLGLQLDGRARFMNDDEEYWPLYEGKYIYLLEHRYGSFETVPAAKRYGRKANAPTPRLDQLRNPRYEIIPRYWFPRSLWRKRCEEKGLREDFQFHYRDVAGVYPDIRTAIGAIVQAGPAGDKAPALGIPSVEDPTADALRYLAFTALFNSIPFDYVVRNKLFSKSFKLNTLSQIPMPPPKAVVARSFDEATLQGHMARAALELSFTTWSLAPLGVAVGREQPFVWDAERRFALLREIDAAAAHFYGLSREEFAYVLSTFQTLGDAETRQYGSFRTRDLALSIYDAITEAKQRGEPYRSQLTPEPADEAAMHQA